MKQCLNTCTGVRTPACVKRTLLLMFTAFQHSCRQAGKQNENGSTISSAFLTKYLEIV